MVGLREILWPRGSKAAAVGEESLAELFDAGTLPHALAPQASVSLVVSDAVRLDKGNDRLDDEAPAITFSVLLGQSEFQAAQPLVVVHAEEQNRIDGCCLDGLAQKGGRAGLGQQFQAAWRLDTHNPDYGGRGYGRARFQQRRRADRLVRINKQNVPIVVERREFDLFDADQRHTQPNECALQCLGVEFRPSPKNASALAKILDQPLPRHEATRKTGLVATTPKRDEFRIR